MTREKPDISVPNEWMLAFRQWKRRPGAAARALVMVLLLAPAACTGSPATRALPPDFEVMTGVGVSSVSIHKAFPDTTDAESVEWVRSGMQRAGFVITGPVEPPFPSSWIVWHVESNAPRATFRMIVTTRYVCEQTILTNGAPRYEIVSAVESLSRRLLATMSSTQSQSGAAGC